MARLHVVGRVYVRWRTECVRRLNEVDGICTLTGRFVGCLRSEGDQILDYKRRCH